MHHQAPEESNLDIASLTGTRLGPYNSFNPVNRVQIWQWCSALGDHNPLYLDEGYQRRMSVKGAVSPPAMIQMWTMRDVNLNYAPGSTDAPPYQIFDTLSEHGFPANVAVSYDLTFHRYLREGDRVHHFTTVVNISALKQTSLGRGHFVTERVEYLDETEQPVAEALITYFQYQPADTNTDNTSETSTKVVDLSGHNRKPSFTDLRAEALEQGQALPELVIPITHKLIISGAVASQDYIDVHHNAPAARAAAMPDIFMNILTTCGLTGRYLSDWAGPASRLQKLSFKLMAPNTPGDTMVMQGRVRKLSDEGVEVDFAGRNSRGFHLTGSATLTL